FFFQAEDGIRDATVTGVQTCALPISGCAAVGILLVMVFMQLFGMSLNLTVVAVGARFYSRLRRTLLVVLVLLAAALFVSFGGVRSEERRVGKECGRRR